MVLHFTCAKQINVLQCLIGHVFYLLRDVFGHCKVKYISEVKIRFSLS